MEHQAFLAVISEVAATFAGFTGIVAVFRFRDGKLKSFELNQFATMLRASLSALFLSLLPYLLSILVDNDAYAWRTCSLIVAVVMAVNIVSFAMRGGVFGMSTMHRIMFPVGILIAASNALAVFELLPANKVFVIAVSWQLLVAANNFITLIMSDVSSSESEAEVKADKDELKKE